MLTNLLDGISHATCSRGFTWCSMKSIGSVSLCNKIPSYLLRRASIRMAIVSCLMAHLLSSIICKVDLQDNSYLFTNKHPIWTYMSFTYETIQDRNIPLERNRIQIWVNTPINKNTGLVLFLSQRNYLTRSSVLCWSETHKSFLHACTPERRTRALAHLFIQREHGHTPNTKNISFKKIFGYQKRWATIRAVEQVYHTALNTSGLHAVLRGSSLFIPLSLWRCCYDCGSCRFRFQGSRFELWS
jgi:hypothetical protein